MTLDWDETKRSWTLAERGLDFASIATIDWNLAFTFDDKRLDYQEQRLVTMAPIQNRLCVFVWCKRGDKMRIISLRKANDREMKRYAQALD